MTYTTQSSQYKSEFTPMLCATEIWGRTVGGFHGINRVTSLHRDSFVNRATGGGMPSIGFTFTNGLDAHGIKR